MPFLNLHKVASNVINAVNPNQRIKVECSNGYMTQPSGIRVPSYLSPVYAYGQVQDLTGRDLRQLDMLNIQGSERKIYITGTIDAITRISQTGGDLITLFDNTVWLTTRVLERWPLWCTVSVTLQNGS